MSSDSNKANPSTLAYCGPLNPVPPTPSAEFNYCGPLTSPPTPTAEFMSARWHREGLGLLTEDEFAAAVGVAVARVGIWRGKGQGPAYAKLGKRIFYRTQDIAAWVASCVVHPEPADGE